MSDQVYIHYGDTRFRPKLFKPVRNIKWRNKPSGGLWASPVNAEYGWKQWCEENAFGGCEEDYAFKFTLVDNVNIFRIRTIEDVWKMPQAKQDDYIPQRSYLPDFEKMLADGVDAIEYTLSNDWRLYDELYGWDCDCILILNPDVIREIKNK